jgi:2,3-dihydroxybiphenyl 1,2-dioxygenase
MDHELELAYLVVEVADRGALDGFLTDTVGLVAGPPTPDGLAAWRNDDRMHRILASEGPANDAVAVGFEAVDEPARAATVTRLRDAGYALEEGSAEEVAARRVRTLHRARAPWGVDVEVVTGLGVAPEPFASAHVPGGFLTRGVGFGHVVFATTALEEAHRFATAGLGLRRSDWMETEIAEGVPLEARFYHCNARHHSLALARAPFEPPQRLHHLMVEANDVDDVGAAYDRAFAGGLTIASGLGRHDNDRMFSFYVVTPAGFQLEFGQGGRTVTDPWDDDRRYDRISLWGHQPVSRP